jgi:hypothetical protein
MQLLNQNPDAIGNLILLVVLSLSIIFIFLVGYFAYNSIKNIDND